MNGPVLPDWLAEAGDQFADTYVPLTRMPGVPGPVKVSVQGLLAAAYVAGWEAARDELAAGVPSGARVLTAEQWDALRDVLCKATGWRQAPTPEPTPVEPDAGPVEPRTSEEG